MGSAERRTLDWVLNQLTHDGQPENQRLQELTLKLCSDSEFFIYTDARLIGIADDVQTDAIHFEDDDYFEYITSGTDFISKSTSKLIRPMVYLRDKSTASITAQGFINEGKIYWCTSENFTQFEGVELKASEVFFLDHEVKNLKRESNRSAALKNTEKGLALLALYIAYNDDAFQKAGTVNASKIGELIQSLAEEYKPFADNKKLNSVSSIHNDIKRILKAMRLDHTQVGAPYDQ